MTQPQNDTASNDTALNDTLLSCHANASYLQTQQPPNPRNGNNNDEAHPPIHPTKLKVDGFRSQDHQKIYEVRPGTGLWSFVFRHEVTHLPLPVLSWPRATFWLAARVTPRDGKPRLSLTWAAKRQVGDGSERWHQQSLLPPRLSPAHVPLTKFSV
jgi:DNA topoisomerase IA